MLIEPIDPALSVRYLALGSVAQSIVNALAKAQFRHEALPPESLALIKQTLHATDEEPTLCPGGLIDSLEQVDLIKSTIESRQPPPSDKIDALAKKTDSATAQPLVELFSLLANQCLRRSSQPTERLSRRALELCAHTQATE